MKDYSINDLISDKITGEWGDELTDSDGTKILRTTNFTNEGRLNFASVVERKIKSEIVEKKKLLPGDIIVEKSGGSPNQPVGRVVYFDVQNETYLCNNFTAVLRPSNKVYPKYLFYALFNFHLTNRTLRYQNKTTGILNLKLERYLNEERISLPPFDTQQTIAQILSEADKARQLRKQANALTGKFLQSTFLSMFGDPVSNPKGWEMKKIGDVTDNIIAGKSVQSESRRISSAEYGVLKVSAVTYGIFKPEEHKAIVSDFIPDQSIIPRKGDLLFSRANTKEMVAATCIVDQDYPLLFLPDKLWKIVLDQKAVLPWFFKYVLSQPPYRAKLSEKATGTSGSMFNISQGKLLDFLIPTPPIKLQQQFVAIITETEQLRHRQRAHEQELDQLFKGLLQKYFG